MIDMPPQLFAQIRAYLAAGKFGKITLDVQKGKIISWSLTEVGRVDNRENVSVT